jgi:hypothetical protein
MLEVEGIGCDIFRGVMFTKSMRLVGVLRDCDGLVEHGEDEAFNAFFM